ncbi:hypothetical protein BDW62DRAFT_177999 [Aspergillus aurantiobrunneus]
MSLCFLSAAPEESQSSCWPGSAMQPQIQTAATLTIMTGIASLHMPTNLALFSRNPGFCTGYRHSAIICPSTALTSKKWNQGRSPGHDTELW